MTPILILDSDLLIQVLKPVVTLPLPADNYSGTSHDTQRTWPHYSIMGGSGFADVDGYIVRWKIKGAPTTMWNVVSGHAQILVVATGAATDGAACFVQ